MTILPMARPVAADVTNTPEAQEARWIAWTAKGAAADRIRHERMRMVFVAIVIALACVMVAVVL